MKERIYTVGFMVIVCAVATAAMTGAQILLRPRIQSNEQFRQKRLILQGLGILPEKATESQVAELYEKQVTPHEGKERTIFVARDKAGAVFSIGMEFQGPGFWGPIKGILSLDPQLKEIRGIVFTQQQETPGLGARITEPWFLKQFIGKNVAAPRDDKAGEYLVWRPEGVPATGAKEVDAISGATRTSDSVKKILDDELALFHKIAAELQAEATIPGGGT